MVLVVSVEDLSPNDDLKRRPQLCDLLCSQSACHDRLSESDHRKLQERTISKAPLPLESPKM